MAQGDVASQQITQIDSQPEYSVGDELEGGARPINSIEDVLNLTDAAELWILAKIVSVESEVRDWCYLACTKCSKKVNKVRLNIIVADGTRCLNLMLFGIRRQNSLLASLLMMLVIYM
ncbi:hypothetical protein PIB30_095718 [Stylosanthes scabra]|uniref:Uncharacterized protein n=1 Tax=Stylosanthes scabra TaxID=79078 RepID=A0ABU6QWK7_9FABA|nr:hypothetical protein [Stylosanthes scabra]